jgi:hypothetical protein
MQIVQASSTGASVDVHGTSLCPPVMLLCCCAADAWARRGDSVLSVSAVVCGHLRARGHVPT